MEEEKFSGVGRDTINLLRQIIQEVLKVVPDVVAQRQLELALVNLDYHPLVPANDLSISFRYEDVSFTVFYGHYKIELSDYVSENSGFGYDHYQRYRFLYSPEGDNEEEGDLLQFEEAIMSALRDIEPDQMSVSEEE